MLNPRLSIIAAVSRNQVIGKDGRLPWHLPADWSWFKQVTMGHPVIMGRRTFESMSGSLKGRRNIVVSRHRSVGGSGIEVATDLDGAVELAGGEQEIFIAGGEQIYRQALGQADRMYLTRVHADFEGDTFFPEFSLMQWHLVEQRDCPRDDKNPHGMTFEIYDRSKFKENPKS